MKPINNITLVGTGNVAHSLLPAFISNGFRVVEVIGRNQTALKHIKEKYGIKVNNDFSAPDSRSELIILAISDDSIGSVAEKLRSIKTPVVHTAGSVSIDVFRDLGYKEFGVFYPLQTFSKERLVDFSQVPLYLEANTEEFEVQLMNLARTLSSDVQVAKSDQRAMLHIAAVFACNFSNHMMVVAQKLTTEKHLDFKALLPLVKETFEKAITVGPINAQTGPAVRKNQQVLDKHTEMLQNAPLLQEIYCLLSKSIQEIHIKKD